jgi:hypothetical protein
LAASGLSDCGREPKSTRRGSTADVRQSFVLVFTAGNASAVTAIEVPSLIRLPSLVSGGAQRRNTAKSTERTPTVGFREGEREDLDA